MGNDDSFNSHRLLIDHSLEFHRHVCGVVLDQPRADQNKALLRRALITPFI